ncbi:NEDD4-binding protein 1 [Brachyhypopomus gauderio]|uniref:NEDD4-binding protein 1 n=1 Tax=Brachyhypopomus gauderio TaxID=698409 RepID=UPI004041634A
MSTTRPPHGVKRIPEVSCAGPPGNGHSSAASKQLPGTLTTDEFAVHEEKENELKSTKPRVEKVFKVTFTIIGLLDHTRAYGSQASRPIWLQLKGDKEDVLKAKEYVKGLCDPELQKEERYPVDMHCIFAGAQGLFLDRLLRDTSAEVQVLEPGRLKLLGCAEAVVMAQSRVQQFVALFKEKRSLPSDREPLVKRTFKTFVEERADKYTMELLLLPSALKEELLGLAQSPTQPGGAIDVEQDRSQTSTPVTELSNYILDASFEDKVTRPMDSAVVLNGRPSHKRRSSESEQRDTKRQYSLERRDEEQEREEQRKAGHTHTKTPIRAVLALDSNEVPDEGEAVSPETNLRCLVNFFRTMGYQQEVVERVVWETGQTEDTFLLLERIVEETEACTKGGQRSSVSTNGDDLSPSTHALSSSSSTCVRHKEKDRVKSNPQSQTLTATKPRENSQAASSNGLSQKNQTVSIVIDDDDDVIEMDRKSRTVGPLDFRSDSRCDYLSRGGSQTVGPIRLETVTMLRAASQGPHVAEMRPGCSYQTISGRVPLPHVEPAAHCKATPLTGVSRFRQTLCTPYQLVLQDEPGRRDLRHIIIDGSNVAMAHGLHRIFSCRGIAIAVEAFWRRGHREITVFVPQWRQKRDPNITEQHFLTQLEDLRLLSFTPSREVCGQRISSHDDRFFLHLAEKTGGVIVTNDNMRDFVTHSEAWKKIIQERLLQYTFVEDHFMIPDDPLGKHGPDLEHFLRKNSHRPATCLQRTDLRVPSSAYPQTVQSVPPASRSHKTPTQRSPLETTELKKKLYDIFPDQKQRIDCILNDNPYMRDLNALSGLVLG